jgi:hypothetical protein
MGFVLAAIGACALLPLIVTAQTAQPSPAGFSKKNVPAMPPDDHTGSYVVPGRCGQFDP